MSPDASTDASTDATTEATTARDYPRTGGFDEVFAGPGEVRDHYRSTLDLLADVGLERAAARIRERLAEEEVAFGGEDAHPFTVDPVPRLLTRTEWDDLADGLGQRVRALDAFVADVYGERRAVEAGVVPEHVVTGASYLEPDLQGARPAGGAWISVAGLDVVRDREGRFRVLEDNVRTPSGLAYMLAATDVVDEVLGLDRPGPHDEVRAALRRVLEASAPDVDGALVLVSDGPSNTAWWEQQRLAGLADLALATPEDLRRRGSCVELVDGRRVRAVYRRTEQDRLRDPGGGLTPLGELLLDPLRDGEVGLVNAYGTGVADDKDLYGYVDDLVRFYLEEEPRVPSVLTYDLTKPERVPEVLDRLEELVVKPRSGQGGAGVVIGSTASAAELGRLRDQVAADPEDWIAQEEVRLSTHPTVVGGRLVPRHVDLRPFVFNDGTTTVVPPGGLTRVALEEGQMVVNSSRDGGGKATWVTRG